MKGLRNILLLVGLLVGGHTMLVAQVVVLKLDDIGANHNTCKALPVMEYLIQREVKASYGVIANRLDGTAKPMLQHILAAKNKAGEPLVEIWNHGLDHTKDSTSFEFKDRPYAVQFKHLKNAHIYVKKYLGVDMTTFGAPFNAIDSVCLRAIQAHGGYTRVFFAKAAISFDPGFKRLNNYISMEKETGKPSFEFFMEQYNQHPEYHSTNMILQGHPPYWTEQGFAEFKRILDFLDKNKYRYELPSNL